MARTGDNASSEDGRSAEGHEDPPAAPPIHVASQRRVQPAVVLIALIAAVAALVAARSFLMPVLLALLLNLTFAPVRRWATRRGVPPAITSALVVLSLFVGVGAVAMALSTPVQDYATRGPELVREVEYKLRGLSEMLETVAEAGEKVDELAGEEKPGDPEKVVVQQGPDLVTRVALSAPSVLAQVIFTLVLLFFLMASGNLFYEKIVQANPTFADKRRAIGIAYDIERQLSRYFLTITLINFGLGVAIGVMLWGVGMPNPLLFGVMGFLLNFIPYIGAVLGAAITFGIGVIQLDTVSQAFLAAGGFLALTSIEGQLITPYTVGRRLELNPVVVFLAVAFWGWAWSVIGMFVAVPVLIAIRVFCDHVPRYRTTALFLAGPHASREKSAEAAEEAEEEAVEVVRPDEGKI
ncbi:AI-2E family transporter [Roseivivax sp. CAU 1761]